MAIIKSTTARLNEAVRENKRLQAELEKYKEMTEFIGILNDVDIEDLMDAETEQEDIDNG